MNTTSSITRDQAEHILTKAKANGACAGQYRAAARALNRNDLDAFERVCRASHVWLAENGIDYVMTDGIAEWFYLDGALRYRCTFKDGKREGLAEWFHPDGTLSFQATYRAE